MASFVKITVDTASPTVELTAPTYTTPSSEVEIIVQSNEELGLYQEFYFIDSLGDRHDFTFEHKGDHFVGRLFLNQTSIGIGTFYARVKDTVDNPSALVSKTINVIESEILFIESDFVVLGPVLEYTTMELSVSYSQIELELEGLEYIVEVDSKQYAMEVVGQTHELIIGWSDQT